MTVRPAPTATGTLERRPLAHLLVYVLERGLSGTLDLAPPSSPPRTLVFVSGHPAKLAGDEQPAGVVSLVERTGALFALPPGTAFAYYDSFDALDRITSTPIPALRVIWQGLRAAPPREHVKAAIARVGALRLRLTATADASLSDDLDGAARVLERLRSGAKTVKELSDGAASSSVELLVYALLITKRVEIVGAEGVAVPPPQPSSPSLVPSGMRGSVPDATAAVVEQATPVARINLRRPSVPVGAVAEESISLSRGDRRVSTTFDPKLVDAQLVARRTEILERVKTIDDEDYFTMLGVARDVLPADVQSAFISLAKTWHPDRLPPPLADVKDQCAKVFARMSEAQSTLVDAERRARYMNLLKDGEATPNAQDEVAQVLEAATAFQKAEVFLKRNSMAEAEQHAARAVKLDPKQADYHALLAWLVAIKPEAQSEEATKKQVAALSLAIQMNAKCERAFFYRAMLYKRLKDDAAAIADFRTAAELNPRNVDAQREVRLFEMRAGKKPTSKSDPKGLKGKPGEKPGEKREEKRPSDPGPEGGKGIFGRFFKK